MKKLITTTILILFAVVSMATVYWVSPTGTDAATGRTRSAAWQTLDKVSAEMQSGDIIRFKRSATWNDTLFVNASNVQLIAWGEGKEPVIQYVYVDTLAHSISFQNITVTTFLYPIPPEPEPEQYPETYSGTIYYVSSSTGSDSNPGTKAEPFQTLTKASTLTPSPNDAVLLYSLDTLVGTLTVNTSGTSGNQITFGAYGPVTSKPVVIGSEEITGWTLHSDSIWKATFETTINQLFVNNIRMQAARFPATGFETVDSAPTTSSLTDAALNGALDYTGVICLIHSSSYGLDKRTVTSSSGTTLTLNSAPFGDVTANEKYILVGKLEFLTAAGQWFYDDATNTVYLWKIDGTEPTDTEVRGSTLNYGVYADNKDYVSIKDIEVLQQKVDGIYFTNSDYFTFENITSTDADAVGLHNYLGHHGTIENCTTIGANHYGIENYASTGNCQINYNTVRNIALFDNLGLSGIGDWWMGSGIFAQNSVTTAYNAGQINHIRYNRIDSVGYNGIHFANEGQVEYNYITHCGFTKNDGGFIYTAGGLPPNIGVNANSIIRYNIGLYGHGIGASPYFEGGYADQYSKFITMEYNTFAYVSRGIFFHEGNNHIGRFNTIFDADNGLYVSKDGDAIELNNNIVYGISGQEVIHLNLITGTPVINSNNYINKYTSNPFEIDWTSYYTFTNWKSTTGYDALSTFDNTALAAGYSERLIVNPTDSVKLFHLNYAAGCVNAATGASLTDTFSIQPYSSIIVTGMNLVNISESVITYSTPTNIGFNTQYATNSTTTVRRAMPVTFTEDGLITSVSFYHGGGTGTALVGVYADDGTAPSTRLAVSAETALEVSEGWNTIDLINPLLVENGTKVWLAVTPSIGGLKYEAALPYRAQAASGDYTNGLPNPFGLSNQATGRYSIYCTYLK